MCGCEMKKMSHRGCYVIAKCAIKCALFAFVSFFLFLFHWPRRNRVFINIKISFTLLVVRAGFIETSVRVFAAAPASIIFFQL